MELSDTIFGLEPRRDLKEAAKEDFIKLVAEQMQSSQNLAWADNAIKLAVDMTVAAINRVNLQGNAEEQAKQEARQIHDRVLKGEDLGEIAKKVSAYRPRAKHDPLFSGLVAA